MEQVRHSQSPIIVLLGVQGFPLVVERVAICGIWNAIESPRLHHDLVKEHGVLKPSIVLESEIVFVQELSFVQISLEPIDKLEIIKIDKLVSELEIAITREKRLGCTMLTDTSNRTSTHNRLVFYCVLVESLQGIICIIAVIRVQKRYVFAGSQIQSTVS